MARKQKDPASHWVTATQSIVEFLGEAGRTEDEVRRVLGEGLDASIGMYYASKREQSGSADRQAIRSDQPAAIESGTSSG